MGSKPKWFLDRAETPLGELLIVVDGEACLRALGFTDHEPRIQHKLERSYGKDAFSLEDRAVPRVARALRAYFAGELGAIDDLPVEARGTPFQRRVWAALREIPCGTTISYGELARRIGQPSASRAVGLANNANPVGIVVPCHRVIGADGSLTGYGGGIERKRWLLEHEQKAPTAPRRARPGQLVLDLDGAAP